MLIKCRYIVVRSSNCLMRTKHFDTSFVQTVKSLGAGYFMNKMFVNIQDGRAIINFFDDMLFPDFIKQCLAHFLLLKKLRGVETPRFKPKLSAARHCGPYEKHLCNHCFRLILFGHCLLYTSPSPRDRQKSRMPS